LLGSESLLEKHRERQIPNHHSIIGVDKLIGVYTSANIRGDVSPVLNGSMPNGVCEVFKYFRYVLRFKTWETEKRMRLGSKIEDTFFHFSTPRQKN